MHFALGTAPPPPHPEAIRGNGPLLTARHIELTAVAAAAAAVAAVAAVAFTNNSF